MGPLALASDPRSSLPAELTAFVGRRHERADVRRRLSESRLVTLTGFGGVGKTRLAIRVATEVRRGFPDGVWFAPLGELSDPGLLPESIGNSLGIHDVPHRLGVIQLSEYLRQRDVLLVLDNCEHLIDPCAVLVDTLLRTCPRLRVLATSREALRIEGEAVTPVDPLRVPHDSADVATAADYEGVRLFLDRANQAVPGFTVDDQNRLAVLGICQHLEGIPLALELAAVRMRAMSPDELLERLNQHWELLDLGSRGSPDRHRTMTACLEWSYALCSPEERDLWAELSVFNGGMEMDAIEYVAAARASSSNTVEHLADLVQSLVDKSILTSEPQVGRARYRMLETLRRFGQTRLASSEQEHGTARRRHRDFYVDLVTRVDAAWMSPRQTEGLLRLRREEANLRIALEYCFTEPAEGATGLALVARLRKYAIAYGWFSEGRTWLHRLLPLVPEPSMTRFMGLRAACWLASQQGDREEAESLLAEARQLADTLGSAAVGLADQTTGRVELLLGDFTAAMHSLEVALVHLGATGNLNDLALTYQLLAQACAFAGDLDRAKAAHEACQDICRRAGESWCLSYSLWHLGLVVWARGESPQAAQLVRDSLRLKRHMEEQFGVALCLEALAWIQSDEDPRESATLLGATDTLWKSMGTSLEINPGLFPLRQKSEASIRSSMGTQSFADAYAEGLTMTRSAAIALALGEKAAQLRPVDDVTRSDLAALTKREREVAELVAAGLSNKEIASKLVISPRTAEAHVENILTKLGFTTRTQVAAWLAGRGSDAI